MPGPDQQVDLRERLKAAEEASRKYRAAVTALRKIVKTGQADAYQAHRETMADRSREQSQRARDIGEIPAVKDPELRKACATDFRLFCEAHFPAIFFLPWSPDHLKVIAKIEAAVLHGGLFAVAMPRGFGKTSLCQCAVLWALLYGHRRFVALIGAEAESAGETLDAIKMELESNDVLLDQFPEAAYPIRCLEGIAQRRLIYKGKLIRIAFTATRLILPDIPESPSRQGILKCSGITGRIRGMHYQRPDGSKARPDLVLLDDPQTDESAKSVSQCKAREATIYGAVLGLAGPKRKIAGLMAITVVQAGDLADRCLDPDISPFWQSEKTQLVYAFPTNERLWKQYREVYAEALRNNRGAAPATEFYSANRQAMDEGARVAWDELYDEDEASAIQHAMNLHARDEASFWAEFQNDPRSFQAGTRYELTARDVAEKVNRLPKGTIPVDATALTAFVDVQQRLLYWIVAAWREDFTGWVVDYGTFPEQQARHFTARTAQSTLQAIAPTAGVEGSIYAGLEELDRHLFSMPWRRADGANLTIDLCMVDANWGEVTDTVYDFCRRTASRGRWMPSHGKYIGAASEPMKSWQTRPGDRAGSGWKIPNLQNRRAIRYCIYDTNLWKSFVHARLAVAQGDRGCLSLFGDSPEQHESFAAQIVAEYRVETHAKSRRVDEWKQRPSKPDNHWFDCLVGSAVAASIQGCKLAERMAVAPGPADITAEMIAAYNLRRRR